MPRQPTKIATTTGPVACESSDGNQRGEPVGMKTYCRGLAIDRAIVEEAYREWCEAPAGKKNAWRVVQEHGSAASLIDEVAREIAERRLVFEPIHRYDHIEPTNGKVRTIGVSSVKQQLVDYVVVHCCADFLKARVGHYQASSVKGKGATFTMRTIRKWVTGGGSSLLRQDGRAEVLPLHQARRRAGDIPQVRRFA